MHASRAHVRDTVEAGRAVLALTLPRTKTSNTGAVVTVPSWHTLCPVRAWRAHLLLSPAPDSAHLFSYRVSGRLVPLSCSVFLTRLGKAAAAADLPILSGHSFRIGGCTELLRSGSAIEDVKAAGRQKSDAWTLYMRDHPAVFAQRLGAVTIGPDVSG